MSGSVPIRKQSVRFLIMNMLTDLSFLIVSVGDEEMANSALSHIDSVRVLCLDRIAKANVEEAVGLEGS